MKDEEQPNVRVLHQTLQRVICCQRGLQSNDCNHANKQANTHQAHNVRRARLAGETVPCRGVPAETRLDLANRLEQEASMLAAAAATWRR